MVGRLAVGLGFLGATAQMAVGARRIRDGMKLHDSLFGQARRPGRERRPVVADLGSHRLGATLLHRRLRRPHGRREAYANRGRLQGLGKRIEAGARRVAAESQLSLEDAEQRVKELVARIDRRAKSFAPALGLRNMSACPHFDGHRPRAGSGIRPPFSQLEVLGSTARCATCSLGECRESACLSPLLHKSRKERARLHSMLREHVRVMDVADPAMLARIAGPPRVILAEFALPRHKGVEQIRLLRRLAPASEVVALSAVSNPASVVTALKAGAFGFLSHEEDTEETLAVISRRARLRRDQTRWAEAVRRPAAHLEQSRHDRGFGLARHGCDSSAHLLVTGELGTGRKTLVRSFHRSSPAPGALPFSRLRRPHSSAALFAAERGWRLHRRGPAGAGRGEHDHLPVRFEQLSVPELSSLGDLARGPSRYAWPVSGSCRWCTGSSPWRRPASSAREGPRCSRCSAGPILGRRGRGAAAPAAPGGSRQLVSGAVRALEREISGPTRAPDHRRSGPPHHL